MGDDGIQEMGVEQKVQTPKTPDVTLKPPPPEDNRFFLSKIKPSLRNLLAAAAGLPFLLEGAPANINQVPQTPQGHEAIAASPKIPAGGEGVVLEAVIPSPTAQPLPTESPPIEETLHAGPEKKEVTETNLIEYLFSDLVKRAVAERQRRYTSDSEYSSRVDSDLVNAPTLNILLQGVDTTRDRLEEFKDRRENHLSGNSDILMVLSINIKTGKILLLSIPRDLNYKGEKVNGIQDPKDMMEAVETMTSIPLDGSAEINVDFGQGGRAFDNEKATDSFFDDLSSEGFLVYSLRDVDDEHYPGIGVGFDPVHIKKGFQRLHGKDLTKISRSRFDSGYAREDQQRVVGEFLALALIPSILGEAREGKTTTMDTIIKALEKQEGYGNFEGGLVKDDKKVDLIPELKAFRDKVIDLTSDPETLKELAMKSLKQFSPASFVMFGFSPENDIESVPGTTSYMLQSKGAREGQPLIERFKAMRDRSKSQMVKANEVTNLFDFVKSKLPFQSPSGT